MDKEYPPQYIMAMAKLDSENPENLDILKTHVFDISEEAGLLTASCNDLHLIISSDNWEALEEKIIRVYSEKCEENGKEYD